jgi:hypothetical protein
LNIPVYHRPRSAPILSLTATTERTAAMAIQANCRETQSASEAVARPNRPRRIHARRINGLPTQPMIIHYHWRIDELTAVSRSLFV